MFGLEFDQERMDEAIKYSMLTDDLASLNNGLETMIGERGVNVSGGQKARISLARAIYSDADIYLLDDPLSAVDPQVAKNIFFQCISEYMKDKIVILVTH
jgi:ABC-type multidrug transport system fused ATPase/permease subunit